MCQPWASVGGIGRHDDGGCRPSAQKKGLPHDRDSPSYAGLGMFLERKEDAQAQQPLTVVLVQQLSGLGEVELELVEVGEP